jgi:isoleucyl-tRNA synthetase
VQEARKSGGLDVSDRINLVWRAGGRTAEALRENGSLVAAEVLAVDIREGEPADVGPGGDGASVVRDDDLDLVFSVTKA